MRASWLIVGNWKMNLLEADVKYMMEAMPSMWPDMQSSKYDLVICPPFPLLSSVRQYSGQFRLSLGAQDCHAEASGAHTGDVAAPLLRDMGCKYVIVGHSERRADHGETDAMVQAKAQAALDAGLIPIICVGENADERDEGKAQEAVEKQLRGSLPDGATGWTVAVAYEPVWAIGTGKSATLEEIAEMHAHIHAVLGDLVGKSEVDPIRILYGGSVTQFNAGDIMRLPNVNGVLVGGASLKVGTFLDIANATPA